MDIKIQYISFAILYTLILSACSSKPVSKIPEVHVQEEMQTAYPSISENMEYKIDSLSYPPPLSTMSTRQINSLKVDDPILIDSTKGSVSGLIINDLQQMPLGTTDIYLTKGVGPENISMPAILAGSLSSRGDIPGKTLDSGVFMFNDIAPGKYFLIVSMDLSPIYLSPDADYPVLINVEAGKKLNLGIVYYNGE